jgi:hypothetical protein
MRSKWHTIGLILLACWLIARMAFLIPVFHNPGRVYLTELNTYVELATSLVERGTYEGYSREGIELTRTPGYPVFAAVILGLAEGNLAYLALVQVLLTVGTCALVYATTRQLLNESAALAAAWIFALSPTSLFYALAALTETLFAFILLLSVYLLVRFHKEEGLGWLVASSVMLGAAILVRPIGVILIPVWGVFALLAREGQTRRSRLIAGGLAVGLVWLVMLPWQLHNLVANDKFTLTPVGEATLRNWIVAPGLARAKGISRDEAVAEIAATEDPGAYMLEVILTYPRPMLAAQMEGFYRTRMGFEYGNWMNLMDTDYRIGQEYMSALLSRNLNRAFREARQMLQAGYYLQFGVSTWAVAYNWVLYLLVIASPVYLLATERSVWGYALLVLLAGLLLITPFAAGQARFRVPADPFLAILAGMALAAGPAAFRDWRIRRRHSPEIDRRLSEIG